MGLGDVQLFSVSYADPDTDAANVTVTWYVDDEQVHQGDSYTLKASEFGHGEHTVQAVVSDGNSTTDDARKTWIVTVYHPPELGSATPSGEYLQTASAEFLDFSVSVTDPDTDLTDDDVTWYVDGWEVGTGRDYTFRSHDYSIGTHTVRVEVSDGTAETEDVSREWTVEINDEPEFTDISPSNTDLTLHPGREIEFTAEATDQDTGTLTYDWSVDGTPVDQGSSRSTLVFNSTEYEPGEHTVTVTVDDRTSVTNDATHSWTVTVLERPTIDTIQPKRTLEVLGVPVEFNATAHDPNGLDIESYRWQIDGKTYEGRVVSVTFDTPGVKVFNVTVTNSEGVTQTRGAFVTVDRKKPKITRLQPGGISRTAGGKEVILIARAKDPLDRDVSMRYTWRLDGNTYEGSTVTVGPFNRVGVHPVKLTVRNDYGTTRNRTFDITVENDVPSARLVSPKQNVTVEAGGELQFVAEVVNADLTDVHTRFSVDGSPVKETFIGSDSDSQQASVTREFTQPGRHEVSVTLTDGHGASTTESWYVSVNNRPPEFKTTTPNASTLTDVRTGEKQRFAVRATDPDNASVSYQWYFNGTAVGKGHTYAQEFESAGSHNVTVVATDADGGSSRHQWTVRVSQYQPTLVTVNPNRTEIPDVLTGERRQFAVQAADTDARNISFQWYYDRTAVAENRTHTQRFNSTGTHNLTVVASAADGGTTRHEWAVSVSRFTVPPNVTDHTTKTTINPATDRTTFITVAVSNSKQNERTVRVELLVQPTDGVTFNRLENVRSSSRSSVVGWGKIAPGTQNRLGIGIRVVDESLYGQTISIPYTIRYAPVGQPEQYVVVRNRTIDIRVTKPTTTTAGEEQGASSDTVGKTETATNSTPTAPEQVTETDGPGFSVITGALAVVFTILLLWRRR